MAWENVCLWLIPVQHAGHVFHLLYLFRFAHQDKQKVRTPLCVFHPIRSLSWRCRQVEHVHCCSSCSPHRFLFVLNSARQHLSAVSLVLPLSLHSVTFVQEKAVKRLRLWSLLGCCSLEVEQIFLLILDSFFLPALLFRLMTFIKATRKWQKGDNRQGGAASHGRAVTFRVWWIR